MRKTVMVIVLTALVCLLLAACSKSGNSAGDSKDTGTSSPTPAAPAQETVKPEASAPTPAKSPFFSEKPMTVTLMTKEGSSDLPVYKWIKDATNITVKVNKPAGKYNDALALTIAGGDIPDIMFLNSNSLGNTYGQQGALLDLNANLDKMPNFKAFLDAHPDIKKRSISPEGKIFTAINDGFGYDNRIGWIYRDDIFKKENLSVPTTWDELYETLKALKKAYPDSYPLDLRAGTNLGEIDYYMAPAFNTNDGFYPDLDTGEVMYGQVTDNYKILVEYLYKFNKEKLINPDWLSMTDEQKVELMTTGKSFIVDDYIGRVIDFSMGFSDKTASVSQMAPPAGPGGKAYNPDADYLIGGFTVYSKAKNLDAALKYIDFLYSDEGSNLVSWGIEGETYKMVDGKKVLTAGANVDEVRKNSGIATFGSYGNLDAAAPQTLIPEQFQSVYTENAKYDYPSIIVPPAFTKEEEDTLGMIDPQVTKYRATNIANFILGERPLSEWDAYVKEMYNLGLQKEIDIYKEAWARQK